jgi:hypothetical protein
MTRAAVRAVIESFLAHLRNGVAVDERDAVAAVEVARIS